ncbi:MAG: VWA domain-containing protein [Candidatus Acidiferrum sp.]
MAKDMKFAGALILAVATAHVLYSQEPTPPQPATDATAIQSNKSETEPKTEVSVQDTGNTFKLRVNLVQVHVIVRDNAGKPVEGLGKEDFQLFDNGKLQPISTFAVESAQSRKERSEAAEKNQQNEEENAAGNSVTLPVRFVALTFDDVHLKMEDAGPLRAAAAQFVDAMAPADRVGLFSTSGQFTLDFTNDKEALKRKLLGLLPRGQLNSSTTECPNISYYMADQLEKEGWPPDPNHSGPPDFEVFVQETLRCMSGIEVTTARTLVISAARRVLDVGEAENRDTYRQLGSALRTLSSKPGTRVLLLASPGFTLGTLTNEASGIVDLANRANIVINTLDARGLYAPALGGDISQPFSDAPSTIGLKASCRLAEQSDQQFVLMDLAFGTGGTFFHSNDFEAGLKQAGSAPEVSYVLGFSPQNQKMDGRYHTLKVTLPGKNKYAIQARRGYFAPQKLDDPGEIAKQEIQDAMFSQNEIFDLPLTLQTQYFKFDDTATGLSVVSHLDVQRMQFHKVDGRNFDDLTVATVIFDDNGKFVMGGEKLVKMRLLDSSIGRYGHTGFVVKSTFDLKPGKYMVRQVARDSEGAQMAARSAIVVIPN